MEMQSYACQITVPMNGNTTRLVMIHSSGHWLLDRARVSTLVIARTARSEQESDFRGVEK
jgi:hypothetical protein